MKIHLVVLLLFVLGVTSCGRATEPCRGGQFNSGWKAIGDESPPPEEVKQQLIGMSLKQVTQYLGSSPILSSQNGTVTWVFEKRKYILERDCQAGDKHRVHQSFTLIEARFDGGVIDACSISSRGAIVSRLMSRHIALSKDWKTTLPLSIDLGACEKRVTVASPQ